MADFQTASLRAFIACVFIVPMLLYALIIISSLFDLMVPLWLVWAVTTVPPAVAVLVLLARAIRGLRGRAPSQATRAGSR